MDKTFDRPLTLEGKAMKEVSHTPRWNVRSSGKYYWELEADGKRIAAIRKGPGGRRIADLLASAPELKAENEALKECLGMLIQWTEESDSGDAQEMIMTTVKRAKELIK